MISQPGLTSSWYRGQLILQTDFLIIDKKVESDFPCSSFMLKEMEISLKHGLGLEILLKNIIMLFTIYLGMLPQSVEELKLDEYPSKFTIKKSLFFT